MAPSRVRIPPSPLAQRPPRFCAHPRRGGRAVECGGLENRYPSLGGSRVQISPPPLPNAACEAGCPPRPQSDGGHPARRNPREGVAGFSRRSSAPEALIRLVVGDEAVGARGQESGREETAT